MTMATIGVRELRDGLSRHLAEVREGLEITVTDHGTPVARITPFAQESGLKALLREGIARAPQGHGALPPRVRGAGTVSDLLPEQRR